MAGIIAIHVIEANILRSRLRNLLSLRDEFLNNPQEETIHDFRVASRRAREILDYLSPVLPGKPQQRLMNLARRITRSLGTARESQVNLEILNKWNHERKIDPIALELIVHNQRVNFEKGLNKAKRRISQRKFDYLNKFLLNLKGSRIVPVTDSGILQKRHVDFVTFQWDSLLDDERLHDLRIRTKKFRYAVEIYNRAQKKKLGRYLRRIRNLQEILGKIHDLYVLEGVAQTLAKKWNDSSLSIIPSALLYSRDVIIAEKQALYPAVYPRYSRILENSPFIQFQDTQAAAV